MATAASGSPSVNATMSKVKRSASPPPIVPTSAQSTPKSVAINPRSRDRPDSSAMMVKEASRIDVCSTRPISMAIAANGAATRNKVMSEQVSPTTDE